MNRGVFQKLHNMRYGNRLAVEADKRMQLFSIKQELKRFAEVQNNATLHLLWLHEYVTGQQIPLPG